MAALSYKFQYVSDIHLEYYFDNVNKVRRLFVEPLVKKKGDADFLMLAGDIGKPSNKSYATFLREVAPHYKRVFVITGNHEYYRMPYVTMEELDEQCHEICEDAGDNVIFLQNERYDICDWLSIYAGTFWTDIPVLKKRIIESSMNDYTYIPNFTADKSVLYHRRALRGLEEEICKSPERMWVVMSHHMPSFDLVDEKYKTSPTLMDLNYAFASDIKVAADPRISAWVYGHTHTPRVDGKFFCNSVGYPGEDSRDWRERLAKFFVVKRNEPGSEE